MLEKTPEDCMLRQTSKLFVRLLQSCVFFPHVLLLPRQQAIQCYYKKRAKIWFNARPLFVDLLYFVRLVDLLWLRN